MGIYTSESRTRIVDVGSINKLTNTGYLRILQEVAGRASDFIGYGPNNMDQTHIAWILLNWKVQIFSRPQWNAKLTIKTWPRNIIKCYSCRDLEVFDDHNNMIAKASSKWVLYDPYKGSLTTPSKEMEAKYDVVDKCVFDNPDLKKIKEPSSSVKTFEYIIQRRDIDTNQHVNNTNYLDFAYESLPKDVFENMCFDNFEIMYKHEAKLGDKISCFYSKGDKNEHYVTIKNNENDKLHAIIKLY